MRISKTPTKRLAAPVKELLEFIDSLSTQKLLDIALELDRNGWPFPKSDLFHWTAVLNQWDEVLGELVTKYSLKELQKIDFSKDDKDVLRGILKLTWYLWENCTNRNLYASYEHLGALLNSNDQQILHVTLLLLTRPATRISSQRNLKNIFSGLQERLICLAANWGEYSDFKLFKRNEADTMIDKANLLYSFYRSSDSSKESDKQGLVSIIMDLNKTQNEGAKEVFDMIVEKYNVPNQFYYPLYFKVRILKDINDAEKRQIWGCIRLLALSVCLNILSQETAQSTFFLYEPDIITKIASVLDDSEYSFDFQLCAIYTMESLCHFRSKLSDVLLAVNASVNHGILLNLIRKMIGNSIPFELAEALNSLVAYIISTQSGGTMLISAGIIPVLLGTVAENSSTRSVTKSVNILDNILYGFPSSFNVFMESNGLEIIVKRIESEVSLCLNTFDSSGDGATLPFDRGTLLRSLLKFVMHLMQTSGSADRMRNLIESTLPKSILFILDNSKSFGANVFGIAINIMATFIHNEPTSLNILQEAKLPQAFLKSITSSMPVSAEVISAIPNAFGAICLNSAGLEAFNESNPIHTYLQVFTDKENLRTVQDNDVPHLVGNSMDELIRHQPSLKESIISALVSMLSKVVELGDFYAEEKLEKTVLILSSSDLPLKQINNKEQQKEEDIVIMIDVVSRLLEGLFQNVAHAPDFIRLGGAETLRQLSQLRCIPYDFTSTPSSFTLSYLFRVLIESDPNRIIEMIAKQTRSTLSLLDNLLKCSEDGSMLEKYIQLNSDLTETEQDIGQKLFRGLINILGLIRLLTDMYCTHSLSHMKSFTGAILSFTGDFGEGLLELLGKLQKVCITEKLFIKKNVPESWYEKPKKEKPADPDLRIVGIGQGASRPEFEMDIISPTSAGTDVQGDQVMATAESIHQNDSRIKNAQMIWHLVNEIPSVVANLFKGLIKLLWGRKVPDQSLRKSSHAMTREIALVICDDLIYTRTLKSIISPGYLKSVLNFLFTLMMDDRSTPSLQTPFVIHLVRAGFLSQAQSIIDLSWNKLQDSVDDGKSEEMADYRSILERCLNIFMILSNSTMLTESAHTIHLTREKDKSSPDYFDSSNHIITIRLEIFPTIQKLLNSPFILKAGHPILKAIIQILLHILKAEGESKSKNSVSSTSAPSNLSSVGGSLVASLFGNRSHTTVADPNKIQQLCEMGFPSAAAERALIQCGNNVTRAADYLLTHPEIVAEASFSNQEQSSDPAGSVPSNSTAAISNTFSNSNTEPMDVVMDNQVGEASSSASETRPSATQEEVDDAGHSSDEKGKEKACLQEELDSLRISFKENLLDKCFVLLVAIPDAIFEIKDLIFLLGKSVSEVIKIVVSQIADGISGGTAKDFGALDVQLRLLALIANDPKYQKDGISAIGAQVSVFFNLVRDKDTSPVAISSLFLILESLLSVSDEPKKAMTSEIVEGLMNEDAKQKGKSKPRKDDLPSETFVFSIEEKLTLLESVVNYMKLDTLDNDLYHALLRVIVRLTRHYDLARKFLELGGLPLLFNSEKLVRFPAQQQLTLMVLRHLVEEPDLLKEIFKHEITTWFSQYRPRAVELNNYLKNFSHLSIRNSELFIEVTCSICCLSKYDLSGRTQSLLLKPKDPEEHLKKGENNEGSPIKVAKKSESVANQNCVLVIRHIITSILAIKSNKKIIKENDDIGEKEDLDHIQRCFYLQCLSELIISYSECRKEVINVSTKRISGKTPIKSTGRNHFLNHLLHELLYKDIKYLDKEFSEIQDMSIRKKSVESFWACSVLCGLCVDYNISKVSNSISEPRKVTLDAIGKYLKDSNSHATHGTEERYGIYIALTELIQRILSYKPPTSVAGFGRLAKPNDDHAIQNSKLMLEDGFVALITSLIADLDEHHPLFNGLLTKMLKPLEVLTKSAISLGRASEEAAEAPEKSSPSEGLSVQDQAIPLESEDNGELSNIYRNSALSMFAPRSDDVEGFSHEEGFEEFSSDESMDDGDEADSEVEDEMEIVVPEPFHGANEYDDDSGESDSSSDIPHESDVIIDGEEWEDVESGESGSGLEGLQEDGESDLENVIELMSTDYEMDEESESGENDVEDEEDQENFDADDFDAESNQDDSNMPIELQDSNFVHPFDPDEEYPIYQPINPNIDRQRIMELDVGPDGLEIHWAQRSRPDDVVDNDIFNSRPGRRGITDESLTHPLLQQRVEVHNHGRSGANSHRPGGADRSNANGDLLDWQAFDDAVGGNALQILEQIFSRTRGRASGSLRVVEVPPGISAGGMTQGAFDSADESEDNSQKDKVPGASTTFDQLSLLHSFTVNSTIDRWKQEMKLMYASSGAEKSLRLTQGILNILIPLAKEAAELKFKKDEEERLLREEESRKKKEELLKIEEEKKKESESATVEKAVAIQTSAPSDNPLSESHENQVVDQNITAPAARVMVNVNGREVDITGTGIDITFLEALPDDLRQEVISQHYREQRIALQPATAANNSISPEFLEALPFEIREELLRQEQGDDSSPERGSAEDRMSSQLLANLDMQLRQQLFPENNGSFLPPIFDASSFRRRLQNAGSARIIPSTAVGEKETKKSNALRLEPIQLLEKQALMNLVRLIFVPDCTTNTSLHRILINLSQNNKSRNDIAILLLSILAEGSVDLASVDRNFSQMTIKSGKVKSIGPISPKVAKIASNTDIPVNLGFVETVPNLVAQRSLEALSQLVSFNPLFIDYLLSENDQLSCIKMVKTPSKKPKGKEKEKNAIICEYPVIILLRLLERPYFLENSSLLEQLMTLLSNVFKLFARNKVVKAEKEEESSSKPVSAASESSILSPSGELPSSSDVVESKVKKIHAPKYPALPVHNLKALVYVLCDGVCSSKTFQSTLSVIQNVSRVKEFKDLIAIELSLSSQKLGELVVSELKELEVAMKNTGKGGDVDPKILSIFSSASSQQAKLLRILKAVDFVFLKCQSASTPPETTPTKENTEVKRSEAALIYDQLKFSSMWTQLGEILQMINDKTDMMHIATVLLPLIESFMVVSKPYVVRKQQRAAASYKSFLSVGRQNSSSDINNYDIFVHFTDQHRKILNTMVRNNPSLMGGSFSLLVDNPKILEFDNKKTYFTQQIHKKTSNNSYGSVQVNVRRQYVFEDSYHQLQGRSGEEIKYSKLNVRFYEEEGVDAGGVTREWYTVLARQMFNPDYALFKPSAADKVTYQPNRSSGINPDHLSYFKFVGRIIGKAIYDGRLMDCYFTRSFYKLMLGIEVDYKDMEAIDPSYHKSLEWILNNEITDILDLNFILEVDEFGRQRTVELIPNGKNTPVTDENKHEYVQLIVQQRLVVAIKDQIDAFLTGFHEIIPKDLIKIFNEQELELLISGLPDIDIDDWRNNTEYSNYTPASPQIQWFWRAVRSFSQEERAKLIQFVTGTSKVPLEGFSRLQGSSGVQKFQIHKDFGNINRLPSAHTCFNQLDIPVYESYEQLRSNLLVSISECGTGFGFA